MAAPVLAQPLLLGMMLLQVGNGMQGTLLGIRKRLVPHAEI